MWFRSWTCSTKLRIMVVGVVYLRLDSLGDLTVPLSSLCQCL